MSNLVVRALQQSDLDKVSEVESRIVGHQRKGFIEKRFAVASANPESFITCVAEKGGNVAGHAFARLQQGEFGTEEAVATLDIIGVDSDFRGQGAGKALISEIERQLKQKNIKILRTLVNWPDRAMTSFFSSAGFKLASSRIIERDTAPLNEDMAGTTAGTGSQSDYPMLERDRVFIRSLKSEDLAAVVRIDSKHTGQERYTYYAGKFREVLSESGIMVSLAAIEDGFVTGFIMARVDFGEFGKVEKTAVIETIGIHPGFKGSGVGRALLSQLLVNLAALQVERVRTQVSWENIALQRFLLSCGFGPTQQLILNKTLSQGL